MARDRLKSCSDGGSSSMAGQAVRDHNRGNRSMIRRTCLHAAAMLLRLSVPQKSAALPSGC